MELRSRIAVIVAAACVACLAQMTAAAEAVSLRKGYSPGDEYQVSLATTSRTDVQTRGDFPRTTADEARFTYEARVAVLAIAPDGSPARERHTDVKLSVDRDGHALSLFKPGTSLDVVRDAGGEIQIFHGERRIDASTEAIVRRLLSCQLEHSVASLIDPGRAIEVGESWRLDEGRIQSFLRDQGVDDAVVGKRATATLATNRDGRLVVRYHIPLHRLALNQLPATARGARVKASLDGEVLLGVDGNHRPIGHSSALAVRIAATNRAQGATRAVDWRIRHSESIVQHSETITDELASRS